MGISRIAISVLGGLPLLAQYEATGGKGVNFYTLEKEAALGKQMAAELRLRTTPIDNPTVQDYVDRLGQKLAANVPKTDVRAADRDDLPGQRRLRRARPHRPERSKGREPAVKAARFVRTA